MCVWEYHVQALPQLHSSAESKLTNAVSNPNASERHQAICFYGEKLEDNQRHFLEVEANSVLKSTKVESK